MFAVQPQDPIVVHVVEQPAQSTSLADVIFGALGLTGALLLAALLLGAVLGGILIGVKLLRARLNPAWPPESDSLRVTPGVVANGGRVLEARNQKLE
jgi:hypothetical protein